jgi:hypothetical protein
MPMGTATAGGRIGGSGHLVDAPPDPVPAGWLNRYGWIIDRATVEALAAGARGTVAFLYGSAENESDVRDLFDLVVCLVIDDGTCVQRLTTRTTNTFGRNPEELAAALEQNGRTESVYRHSGAVILDGTLPPSEVADAIVARAARRTS